MRAIILLPLALAACQQASNGTGETAGENTANAVEAVGYSNLQRRVVELPQAQQQVVFLRAIRDGNAPCQGVTEAHRQPDQDGNPVFVALCTDGPAYAIAVNRAGVAQVTRVSPDRR